MHIIYLQCGGLSSGSEATSHEDTDIEESCALPLGVFYFFIGEQYIELPEK